MSNLNMSKAEPLIFQPKHAALLSKRNSILPATQTTIRKSCWCHLQNMSIMTTLYHSQCSTLAQVIALSLLDYCCNSPSPLEQGLANFYCKRPYNKYFRLYRAHSFCCNSTILLQCRSSQRQYIINGHGPILL